MKVFIASLATETNTFAPMPTSMKSFQIVRDGKHSTDQVPQAVYRRMAEERGWEVVESLAAFAEPAGTTIRGAYEALRDEVLDDLRPALPVDMVLLDMHGAMVADGYDDCEGDLIASVREMVGPDVPIGVELDLHCHLTDLMIDKADVIITYKEYPHTDFADRAVELFECTADAAEGKTRPTMALFDCRMIGLYYPTQEPTHTFVEKLKALEKGDKVLSLSLGHGFPWGDVPDVGTKMLVVTDNDADYAAQLAADLGREFFAMREQVVPKYLDIETALARAVKIGQTPVVVADVSDNSGGGAPGDSTFMLRAVLEKQLTGVAIGCIWDPVTVSVAMDAGEGARLDLRIGGKMGPMSGDPVDLNVIVTGIKTDAYQHFGYEGAQMKVPLGDTVAVHAQGIDIVLISKRTQTFSPEVFSEVGIDPFKRKLLIVKSIQHFYAGFAPIASEIIYCAAPGAIVPDFKKIPYTRAPKEHRWPFVDDPFQS